MKTHVKVYMTALGYDPGDWMPCEISVIDQGKCLCNGTAVDVHHIEARGMGGSKKKDGITNLMGVGRECHIEYGDKWLHFDWLQSVHEKFLKKNL